MSEPVNHSIYKSLLLLIPAYNEEARIGPVLKSYAQYLQNYHKGIWKILVVLNGCQDNTLNVVEKASKFLPNISWIEFKERIGKGGALIEGFKHAKEFDFVGFVDADGSTPPHAFYQLVRLISTGQYECVIASRWLPGAKIYIPQSPLRRFFSRAFHLLVEFLFRLGIKDTQCGAKVIVSAVIFKILPALTITDMAFDINLLYSLKKIGARILEVPTEWEDKLGSKVKFGRASIAWLLSLLRLRVYYSPLRYIMKYFRWLELWLYKTVLKSSPPLPVDIKNHK